jgi:hypothetical protein
VKKRALTLGLPLLLSLTSGVANATTIPLDIGPARIAVGYANARYDALGSTFTSQTLDISFAGNQFVQFEGVNTLAYVNFWLLVNGSGILDQYTVSGYLTDQNGSQITSTESFTQGAGISINGEEELGAFVWSGSYPSLTIYGAHLELTATNPDIALIGITSQFLGDSSFGEPGKNGFLIGPFVSDNTNTLALLAIAFLPLLWIYRKQKAFFAGNFIGKTKLEFL